MFHHLKLVGDVVHFSSKSGPLLVSRDANRLVLDFPTLPAEPVAVDDAVTLALGRRPRELLVAASPQKWLAVYEDEEEVRLLTLDFARIAALDARGVIVTAPGSDCDFVSRYFAPRVGVPEDPVTGSAHCTLVPYWAARLEKNELLARQISARGGELFCRLLDNRVLIAGNTVTYLEGEITVPGLL